jgi:osmotically inducible protein OsmC
MAERTAQAIWRGNLKDGAGTVRLGSGSFEGPYSFPSRFESGPGTNPEELIGAAHAACFSMALSGNLEQAGYSPECIETTAKVTIEKSRDGFTITHIDLDTQATVPEIDEDTFLAQAEIAKRTCPVSKALAATEIGLTARLTAPQTL